MNYEDEENQDIHNESFEVAKNLNNNANLFYSLTPDIILDTVETLNVRCTGKIQALNSLENRVYSCELELTDVQQNSVNSIYDAYKVIKFYRPNRWTLNQITEEHSFIQELLAENLEVLSALPLPNKQLSHAEFVGKNNSGIFYSIYPRIGGRLLDELNREQVERIGKLIARPHLVGQRKIFNFRTTLNIENFSTNSINFLDQNNSLPIEIKTRYLDLVKNIFDVCGNWFENIPLQRTHGDLHYGNILWLNDSFTLLDFDDSMMAPAIQDLWLLVPGRDQWQKELRDQLIDSYAELIDFDYETIRLIEPLRALRIINYTAWIARRWEDPSFKNVFTNFSTPQYWRDNLNSLEEILQILKGGDLY